MAFQKGQINNPAGRPVIPEELKKRLKDGYSDVVDFWFETLNGTDDEGKPYKWDYRNKAAENIAHYAYGKPKEIIDLDISGHVDGMTIEIVKKIESDSPSLP
jgi:hypothetical protein